MIQIEIRPGRALDACNIVRLFQHFQAESTIIYPPVNDLDALRWVIDVMSTGDLIVAETDAGRIVGAIGLVPRQWEWNAESWYMRASFYQVLAQFRKGGTGKALLDGAHAIAKSRNVQMVVGVMTADENVDKKERFFGMNGMHYCGGNFVSGNFVKDTDNV